MKIKTYIFKDENQEYLDSDETVRIRASTEKLAWLKLLKKLKSWGDDTINLKILKEAFYLKH